MESAAAFHQFRFPYTGSVHVVAFLWCSGGFEAGSEVG
jgi:hypothetical protein